MRVSIPAILHGLFCLAASATVATPGASCPVKDGRVSLPHRTVVQFPSGIWIENLVVRSNGNLLLTSLAPNASLYEVSKPWSPSPITTLLFTMENTTGLFGIAEGATDVYAIVGGDFDSTTDQGTKGTCNVWTVDFNGQGPPEPRLAAALPDALMLNGAATLPNQKDVLLSADSKLGLVWRSNLVTGKSDVLLQVPEMSAGSDPSNFGINGLQIHNGYLWFTNSLEATLYKVRIGEDGSPASGDRVEKVAKPPVSLIDDFIVGPGKSEVAWVTSNFNNRLFAISQTGQSIVVAGAADSFDVATATAAKFGRTDRDRNILYVSGGGGTINGTTEGGKVEAVDTTGFSATLG